MPIYYGLSSQQELFNHIRRACTIISPGNVPVASQFLIEISCPETAMATALDTYEPEGKGWCQFDSIGFKDAKKRFKQKHPGKVSDIEREFGFKWSDVAFNELDMSPLLCAIFARAKVFLMPERIPESRLERARLWKFRWNSTKGAGTVEHYMRSCERHIGPEIK